MSSNDDKALVDINNEINSVYEYCIAAGLTHEEIVKKAGPLLRPLQKEDWKKRFLMLMKIAICCLALTYTVSSDKVFRSILTNGRLFMFKLLPFWDWTELYTDSCLIENPLFNPECVFVPDCKACEGVHSIDSINNTSPEEVDQLYLQKHIPVIIKDAMTDWPVMKDSFTSLNLTEAYRSVEDTPCQFETNLHMQNHTELFGRLLKEDLQNWYAHWENCAKRSQKILRNFYQKPYFMPNVVQMTQANWILMSSGYEERKYKMLNVSTSATIMWVAQLRGYNSISFHPLEPCDKTCDVLFDFIQEGEIVVFSPDLWIFSYVPGEGTENLAIAVGGYSQLL